MPLLKVLLCLTILLAFTAGSAIYEEDSQSEEQTTLPPLPETTPESITPPAIPKRKCYQCSYSPSRTVFRRRSVRKRVHDPETGKYTTVTIINNAIVAQKQHGGWDKCRGGFSAYEAASFGIDTWDCEYNCAVRVDRAGNLFRGCYRGEFGVDPENVEDVQQVGDSQYRFCVDDLCNRFTMTFQ